MTRITYKAPTKEEREQLECMMKKVREKLIRFGLVAYIECANKPHICTVDPAFGFVPEAGCPVHDP